MQYDYLIIGQGLAGSCMALQLLHEGKRVHVIDDPHANTSSMVAAGIFNPITGRKMVKSWRADDLFPYLHIFYKNAEKELQGKFLNEINIYRPFLDLETQNEWMGKSTFLENKRYVEKVHYEPKCEIDLFDEFGGLEITQSGYIDIPSFIEKTRSRLEKDQLYTQKVFDESKLVLTNNVVKYDNFESKKVIICNGAAAADSSLFGWLPFSLVKGEILEIAVSKLPELIYNRGVFILPKNNGMCRVGASYERNDLTNDVTEKAKKALVDKLNGLYRSKYDIVGHVAGIRPATRDRRPFIGTHPKYPQVGIFNGLGAKGVSLAPYFSKQFVDMLERGDQLDEEVNINRYKSLYYDTVDLKLL